MMIGTCARVGPRAQDAAHLEAAEHRQVEVEDDQIGRLFGDGLSAASPDADDLGVGFAAPLERVLDQPGDVLLVFDNQDAVSGHVPPGKGTGRRFRFDV